MCRSPTTARLRATRQLPSTCTPHTGLRFPVTSCMPTARLPVGKRNGRSSRLRRRRPSPCATVCVRARRTHLGSMHSSATRTGFQPNHLDSRVLASAAVSPFRRMPMMLSGRELVWCAGIVASMQFLFHTTKFPRPIPVTGWLSVLAPPRWQRQQQRQTEIRQQQTAPQPAGDSIGTTAGGSTVNLGVGATQSLRRPSSRCRGRDSVCRGYRRAIAHGLGKASEDRTQSRNRIFLKPVGRASQTIAKAVASSLKRGVSGPNQEFKTTSVRLLVRNGCNARHLALTLGYHQSSGHPAQLHCLGITTVGATRVNASSDGSRASDESPPTTTSSPPSSAVGSTRR